MPRRWKCLREKIREVIVGADVVDGDFARGDLLAAEVVADVDVLRAHMEVLLVGERDGGLIIDVDESGGDLGKMEFGEGTTKPNGFTCSVSERHVLSFHAGERSGRLLLRGPGDGSEEAENESRYGFSIRKIGAPISIRKSLEFGDVSYVP